MSLNTTGAGISLFNFWVSISGALFDRIIWDEWFVIGDTSDDRFSIGDAKWNVRALRISTLLVSESLFEFNSGLQVARRLEINVRQQYSLRCFDMIYGKWKWKFFACNVWCSILWWHTCNIIPTSIFFGGSKRIGNVLLHTENNNQIKKTEISVALFGKVIGQIVRLLVVFLHLSETRFSLPNTCWLLD